jgi:UDP-glucose 6-dehydrogenase
VPYLETTPETAEAIKYASNALLFTYISFWNGVGARIAERFPNVSMDDLRAGVTSDERAEYKAWASGENKTRPTWFNGSVLPGR